MSARAILTCDCGFTGTYRSQAQADYAARIHNCESWTRREAAKRRRQERLSTPGPTRDCQHKQANHQHGTYAAYVLDKCRCLPCKHANRTYESNRKKQQAYGRWQTYIDATPARDHVHALQALGIGWKRIAELAGIHASTMWKLLYGDPTRNLAPSKRVRPATAEAILAVRPSLDAYADRAPVDATGTRRRLQALVARGWTISELGRRLDMLPGNVHQFIQRPRVHAVNARAVRDLYEQLWDVEPPRTGRGYAPAYTRAKNYAAARGWAPPLAWDDESIDDPAATPAVLADDDGDLVLDEAVIWRLTTGDPVKSTHAERAEAVRRLTAQGMTDGQIADRLRLTVRSVVRIRAEHGIEPGWVAA